MRDLWSWGDLPDDGWFARSVGIVQWDTWGLGVDPSVTVALDLGVTLDVSVRLGPLLTEWDVGYTFPLPPPEPVVEDELDPVTRYVIGGTP